MARVRSLIEVPGASKAHPTEVDAEWSIVELIQGRLLQISTYGSDHRKSSGVSQTLQFDQRQARALAEAIKQAFA